MTLTRKPRSLKAAPRRPVACPVCHAMHDLDAGVVAGSHLWDLCPACLRAEDVSCRAALAARGITLPYLTPSGSQP
jgi:hypothetical protein